MASGQRVNDRQKRGILPFETLFDSSRYDFRFPRYRRVKKEVIFNRLLSSSSSLIRTSRSHLASLTYLNLQTSDGRDSWKNNSARFQEEMQVSGSRTHSQFLTLNFKPLYLGDHLIYRDETKRGFNVMAFSVIRIDFDDKSVNYFSHFFQQKNPSSIPRNFTI